LSEGVDVIVVGMPFNPGQSDEQQEKTRGFIRELKVRMLCPVKECDERFTSQEARVRMRESGGGDEHALAAMLILQSYLDSHGVL
jgi:putative transcription antitermination factor YqgF